MSPCPPDAWGTTTVTGLAGSSSLARALPAAAQTVVAMPMNRRRPRQAAGRRASGFMGPAIVLTQWHAEMAGHRAPEREFLAQFLAKRGRRELHGVSAFAHQAPLHRLRRRRIVDGAMERLDNGCGSI